MQAGHQTYEQQVLTRRPEQKSDVNLVFEAMDDEMNRSKSNHDSQ